MFFDVLEWLPRHPCLPTGNETANSQRDANDEVATLSRLPAVERVIPGYHVTAAGANQKADAVVEALGCGLGG